MAYELEVPVGRAALWPAFTDPESMARAVPGLTVDAVQPVDPTGSPAGVSGDVVAGRLRLKVGAGTVTYRGTATIADADPAAGTLDVAIDVAQARGSGALAGYLRIALRATAGGTLVSVVPDLELSGRAAEFRPEDLHASVGALASAWVRALAGRVEAPVQAAVEARVQEEPAVEVAAAEGSAVEKSAAEESAADAPKPEVVAEIEAVAVEAAEPEPVVVAEVVAEPEAETEPEPVLAEAGPVVAEPEPAAVAEPVVAETEPVPAVAEPVVQPEPAAVAEPEPEPAQEPKPEVVAELEAAVAEPESDPASEPEPASEPGSSRESEPESEPESRDADEPAAPAPLVDDSLSDDPLERVWRGEYDKNPWVPVAVILTVLLILRRRRGKRRLMS